MEKGSDFCLKKAPEAKRTSHGHKYELFNINIGSYKPVINKPKADQQRIIGIIKEAADEMSKIVGQSKLIPLSDDFFRL